MKTKMHADATLLEEYGRNRSEVAFAELVRRHVDFVYAAALRQVNGDAHLAQDVTQAVFTDLARKAPAVARHPVLTGWLFTSTRFAAAKQIRGEQRRRAREQEAQLMQATNATGTTPELDWEKVRPVLDDALAELKDREREAVLLRFLKNQDYAQVGAQLSLSDNAARMCVERALEKLHGLLARRGITSTTAALGVALSGQALVAAPAGVATSVTGAALAGGGLATTFTFMSLTKLQLGLASAVVLVGAGAGLLQQQANAQMRSELAAGSGVDARATEQLRTENRELAAQANAAAALTVSDTEWARLRTEASALQDRLDDQARAARLAAAAERARPAPPTLPLEQLDWQPRIVKQAAPSYPKAMMEGKVGGEVLVDFVIDATGKVVNAQVRRSTNPEFEQAALQAIEKWQFKPGGKSGRAVNTRVSQLLQFTATENSNSSEVPEDWF